MAALKVGIMGGTFDPVHNGHLELASFAKAKLQLDRILWIPAGEPWRKADQIVAPAEHRLAMTRLAVAGHDSWDVSEMEIERAGPTYTVDTLEELAGDDSEYYLIMGQDALEDLPNWRQPARLITLATLAVAIRDGFRQDTELDSRLPGLSKRVVWLDMPPVAVSATEVRERAAAGESLTGLVPASVEAYIREHHLYAAS